MQKRGHWQRQHKNWQWLYVYKSAKKKSGMSMLQLQENYILPATQMIRNSFAPRAFDEKYECWYLDARPVELTKNCLPVEVTWGPRPPSAAEVVLIWYSNNREMRHIAIFSRLILRNVDFSGIYWEKQREKSAPEQVNTDEVNSGQEMKLWDQDNCFLLRCKARY